VRKLPRQILDGARRLDIPVDYHCQVAHAQARYLGLLGPAEFAWQVTDWSARLSALS
jgi:hypothetical protein